MYRIQDENCTSQCHQESYNIVPSSISFLHNQCTPNLIYVLRQYSIVPHIIYILQDDHSYHDRYHLCTFRKSLYRKAHILQSLKRWHDSLKQNNVSEISCRNYMVLQWSTSYWHVVVRIFEIETAPYLYMGATGAMVFLRFYRKDKFASHMSTDHNILPGVPFHSHKKTPYQENNRRNCHSQHPIAKNNK